MTLTRGFIRNAATTALDTRLMDMAKLVSNADGSPRVGVIGSASVSIVTALATMNVAVAAAEFGTSKGKADGAAIFTNDGVVNVAIPTAPVSNSRIDVIYVKHNDNTTGDGVSTPIFAVASGSAAATPTKPAIPTGALELATLRVYTGTTAANGGLNTLVNTYQMTAMRGGVVTFRTKSDLDAWTTPTPGQLAYAIDTAAFYKRDAGTWGGINVEKPPHAISAGSGATPPSGYHEVIFPVGRFSVAPILQLTAYHPTNVVMPYLFPGTLAADKFRVAVFTIGGAQVAGTIMWQAVQMTPTTAAG